MATISGDIGLMPVVDLIIWIANRELSCTLQLRRRGHESRMVVRQGRLFQAASLDPREYLGQHLINFGYISEEQLQRAFDTQRETNVPLGRVLVMVDAVSQEQLERVLLFKTRESVLEAMSWQEGAFRLTDEIPSTTELDTPAPIDLHEAHSEAIARASMWHEIRSVFPGDATRVDVLADPMRLNSGFDRRLVQLMAMGRSIGEASLELRSMDFQTYARLYDLYNRGAVRPRLAPQDPAHPPMELPSARSPTPMPFRAELPRATVAAALTAPAPPRAEVPTEAPGVHVPAEAEDPGAALRLALAGRNWSEAMLLSQRILEQDPMNPEAIAAMRVADAQLKKSGDEDADMTRVPQLAMAREQVALAHLTSKERYVLSRVDGRRSLQQIAAVSPIHKNELVRIVNGFVNRGVLRY